MVISSAPVTPVIAVVFAAARVMTGGIRSKTRELKVWFETDAYSYSCGLFLTRRITSVLLGSGIILLNEISPFGADFCIAAKAACRSSERTT